MSRSLKKGSLIKINLIKKNKKWIKIFNKNLVILPEYINLNFNVYNGQTFIKLRIIKEMIGYKIGNFINTRKKNLYKK